MEQARWNQLEDLLQAALDREPHERPQFVREACGDDAKLRGEIEALLSAESDGEVLESPAVEIVAPYLAGFPCPGQQISHYRIVGRIGAGGMGEIYQARDEQLQRVVALKTLPAEFSGDNEGVRRFEKEAFAASRLNHPNIVTIFEFLHVGDMHLIATEHIEGQTLRQILSATPRMPVERALDIAMQIAAALKAAHTAWIIHRDIKPENIMVRADGLVKVLDFGIAKLSEQETSDPRPGPDSSSNPDLTVPGSVLGTASYMSPEQARGEPLDGRTDLFSLGLILYEMLAGQRLFAGATRAEVLHEVTQRNEPLWSKVKLDAVPRELQPVVRKMLRANREERYSSAAELLDDLQRVKRRLENRTARRMVRISGVGIAGALALTGIAALLSVNETWDERVLRDGHTAAVRQAIFSPDGRVLVSCSEDGKIIAWDFATRQRLATLDDAAQKLAFSPDGRRLASGNSDGTIAIWDTATWQRLHHFQAHRSDVGALSFSPDGKLLASAASGPFQGTAVWDTSTWQKVEANGYGTNHGTFLFASSRPQFLFSWELTLVDLAAHKTIIQEPSESMGWIAQSPDGSRLAAIDSVGVVSFYRLPQPGTLLGPQLIVRKPAHQDHGRSIAFSPDGRFVASASEDIVLWDAATHEKIARFEYSAIVWSVTFSPDGRWLVSTHADGAVLVWDVAEREQVASFSEHSAAVRAVAFAPDGRRVASAGEDRSIILWNTNTGRKEAVLQGHQTRVTALAFSSDGTKLCSGDQGGLSILWDVAARRPLTVVHADGPIYSVGVSGNGRFFGTSAGLYTAEGKMLADFLDESLPLGGQVYGQAFSNDGRMLALASTGSRLLLIDGRSGRLLARASVPRTHQITVSFSPDGSLLATGEDEGAVRLWAAAPLRELAVLGRHGARVKSVAFAPDGATVASAGDDKMIALWDVKRRTLRARIGTHTSPIYSIAFSADGKRLVSGEHDRSVRLYTRRRTLWGMRLDGPTESPASLPGWR